MRAITKEQKTSYDRERRERFKAANPDWREQDKARRDARTTEERAADQQRLREYRAAHPELKEKWKATYGTTYRREWRRSQRERYPEKVRRQYKAVLIKKKYGITIDDYEAIEAAQGGACAICGQPETMTIAGTVCTLAVDHDHESGKVRGLLCVRCNMLIGGAKESPETLRIAAAYLEQHRA